MSQEAKIRKMATKRPTDSYQLTSDVVIPAGTILRGIGDDEFMCGVGFGMGMVGEFTIAIKPGVEAPAIMKRVIA